MISTTHVDFSRHGHSIYGGGPHNKTLCVVCPCVVCAHFQGLPNAMEISIYSRPVNKAI